MTEVFTPLQWVGLGYFTIGLLLGINSLTRISRAARGIGTQRDLANAVHLEASFRKLRELSGGSNIPGHMAVGISFTSTVLFWPFIVLWKSFG